MARNEPRNQDGKQKGSKGRGFFAVFDETDDIGFVYSFGNGKGPHFIARNVPRQKVEKLCGTMQFLKDRECKSGDLVHQVEFHFFLKSPTESERQSLLRTHMTQTEPQSTLIFELIPRFESEHPEEWGTLPTAPHGQREMGEAIIKIWRDQRSFILYKDGNPANCRLDNLKYIDLAYALKHAETAKVDWDMNLTANQKSYVRANAAYFRRIAKVLFRPPKRCQVCREVDPNKLQVCTRCKETYYCGRDHQRADWKAHKELCMSMRDAKSLG